MKIKWLGHACFLITSADGTKIITDPYAVGGSINYSPVEESADVVLVSHGHSDHNNVSAVRGKPEVVKDSGTKTAKGIQFKGVATYHDPSQGKQRGTNTVFCFNLDDINLCFLGDLGHVLRLEQVDAIGSVDILFVPVGGCDNIDPDEATQVCQQLAAKVVIPMHCKTPKCGYPIATVDDFLKGKKGVRKADSSEIEFRSGGLPAMTEIVVLRPLL